MKKWILQTGILFVSVIMSLMGFNIIRDLIETSTLPLRSFRIILPIFLLFYLLDKLKRVDEIDEEEKSKFLLGPTLILLFCILIIIIAIIAFIFGFAD
jgi:hypothetical protein